MAKSASAKQQVAEYYMSIHLGVCHGPVDAITGLFVGEKLAWAATVTDSGGIYVNSPNLFGGPKQQGGVGGNMYFLNGDPDQVMPAALANRLGGRTPDNCPAFRGVASVFFVGLEGVASGSLDVSGGSTGSTGGTGSGGYDQGGTGATTGGGVVCVWRDAWLPDGRRAGDLRPNEWSRVLDYSTMRRPINRPLLRYEHHDKVPCVTIVTASGIRKTVSTTTDVTLFDRSTLNVMKALGRNVPVEDADGFRWEQVAALEYAGKRSVAKLDFGGETFAAGDEPDRWIYTHNKRADAGG